jgi:7-cyano-7-deazaguanine reductase
MLLGFFVRKGYKVVKSNSDNLSQLGSISAIPASPGEADLEVVHRHEGWSSALTVRLTCPEFTSMCPRTGQPDFAIIILDYAPRELLIESKAFKLFMASFRNHGAFHEDVSEYIGQRIAGVTDPHWLRVCALWYPRGGIPIDVFWQMGALPKGCYLPALDLMQFRGR